MRLAFVSQFDPDSFHAYSGTIRAMKQALERQGATVVPIGPLREPYRRLLQVRKAAHRLRGRDHLRATEPLTLRGYARQVERALAALRVDAVLSPSTQPLAHVEADVPLVAWPDATFAGIYGLYPEYSRLSEHSVRQAHAAEQAALDRLALAVYSSEWAARSAVEAYGARPARVHVVPYGANVEAPPTAETAFARAAERPSDRITLLWIGKDWARKRGDVAVATVEALRRRGVDATLVTVGAAPPGAAPAFVRAEGFVDKTTSEGRARFNALLHEAHVLLLPTEADCTPIVISEAAAFATPVLTNAVGGIPTLVHAGENGAALPPEATPDAFADHLVEMLAPGVYPGLVAGARRHYDTVLNWDTAAARVLALLRALPAR